MAFIPLKDFLSIWHFKLIGLIRPRAMGERVQSWTVFCLVTLDLSTLFEGKLLKKIIKCEVILKMC